MNQMNVTVFSAKKTQGKIPWSPYNDDTFYFETKPVENLEVACSPLWYQTTC